MHSGFFLKTFDNLDCVYRVLFLKKAKGFILHTQNLGLDKEVETVTRISQKYFNYSTNNIDGNICSLESV